VDAKFGSVRGGWCSLAPTGPYGVGLWKNIRRGWSLLYSLTRFDLGDGSKIRFWDNVWCGESPLKVAFPVLFDIAREKNVNFIHVAHDWGLVIVASFLTLLYSLRGRREGEDMLWWSISRKGTR
jgi:hypothetical protein